MEVDLVDNLNNNIVRSDEERRLLEDKNVLTEAVLEKYRLAGQITQTALLHIESLLLDSVSEQTSVGEIARQGTLFLQQLIDGVYRKSVQEKGVAIPVRLEKEEFVDGVSPEEGDLFQGGFLTNGDLVKITLGVYIDGYTAQASHTVIVRDYSDGQNQPEQPVTGTKADAICAAYITNEALVGFLGLTVANEALRNEVGKITGTRIRWIVETIAKAYRVQIVPGSRVRRVRRFLAGQDTIVQESDFKGVEWTGSELDEETIELENHTEVLPGEVWLIDIQIAATSGKKGVVSLSDFQGYDELRIPQPTIFSRDYSIQYGLKVSASRSLLARVNALASVYPFKLSTISENAQELRSAKLGLKENINHHIIVPHAIKVAEFTLGNSNTDRTTKELKAATSVVPIVREMTTVVLVSSETSSTGHGEVLRLSGGNKTGAPAYVHSQFEVQDGDINKLLELIKDKRFGIRVKVVQPSKYQTSNGEIDVMEE